MKLKKKDFIEVEFTGRIKEGEIFDSNIKKDLDSVGSKIEAKPFVFALGEGMFLRGIEDYLIGKEVGEYEIELQPENAFGKRDSKMIQMIPLKVFKEQKQDPTPGMVFNFDGRMGKVLTASGGRIMVDFNNPISGKVVVYKVKILKKVTNTRDKVKALNEFLFRKDFKFEVKGKKIIMNVDKELVKFVEMFKDKFKEILELELEIKKKAESNVAKTTKTPQ